jgi:hypothetical protein
VQEHTRERVQEVISHPGINCYIAMQALCFLGCYSLIRYSKGGIGQEFSSHDRYYMTMYILGLSPSWGTSRICPAWSLSEHQLTPSLSPIGARVRSHAVRRRLFLFLMTAAHISPVFPSKTSSATYMYCLLRYTHIIHTYYTSHSYKQL